MNITSKIKNVDFPLVLITVLFLLLIVMMLYPFWHCLAGSFMGQGEYFSKALFLFPSQPTLENYELVFGQGDIWTPMGNTAFITAAGTAISLFFTSWVAFGLSRQFKGVSLIMQLIVLTMIIDAGIIPRYLLYKNLGIINTYWVYFLPALTTPFYLIIFRTHYKGMSGELEDAATIDGCNEFGYYFRIALPLSAPILATIGLFLAVGFWNTYFVSLFFITDDKKKTLQEFLYRIVADDNAENFTEDAYFTETLKLANIILTTLPILIVYPFVQKYFVKGMMIGAIKG